jgi:hypothetical protein
VQWRSLKLFDSPAPSSSPRGLTRTSLHPILDSRAANLSTRLVTPGEVSPHLHQIVGGVSGPQYRVQIATEMRLPLVSRMRKPLLNLGVLFTLQRQCIHAASTSPWIPRRATSANSLLALAVASRRISRTTGPPCSTSSIAMGASFEYVSVRKRRRRSGDRQLGKYRCLKLQMTLPAHPTVA